MAKIGAAVGSDGYASGRRRTEGSEPTASGPAATAPSAAAGPPVTALPQEPMVVPSVAGANGPGAGVSPDWRPFLRALASEIDGAAGIAGRDALLRGVGLQLARMYPLPARDSVDGLAMEMTETLDGLGWGSVGIAFSEREHCLLLTHEGLPRVGGSGDPPGTWLAGVLVGLYEGWMAQQPGTDGSFVARRVASAQPGEIVIRYGQE